MAVRTHLLPTIIYKKFLALSLIEPSYPLNPYRARGHLVSFGDKKPSDTRFNHENSY